MGSPKRPPTLIISVGARQAPRHRGSAVAQVPKYFGLTEAARSPILPLAGLRERRLPPQAAFFRLLLQCGRRCQLLWRARPVQGIVSSGCLAAGPDRCCLPDRISGGGIVRVALLDRVDGRRRLVEPRVALQGDGVGASFQRQPTVRFRSKGFQRAQSLLRRAARVATTAYLSRTDRLKQLPGQPPASVKAGSSPASKLGRRVSAHQFRLEGSGDQFRPDTS